MRAAQLLVNVGFGGLKAFFSGSRLVLSSVTSLVSAFGSLASVISTVGLSFGAVSAVISAFILIQTRSIDTLGKTATKLDVATDFLQKFRFAAEQSGVEITTSDMALQRFIRRLGEAQKGTGELLPALRRLGIDVKDSNGEFKDAETILNEFSDGLKETRTGTARLALAFKAFDSEGAALVALLQDGSAELGKFYDEAEALGFILNDSVIKQVEVAADNFNRFTNVINGFTMQVVGALAPAINKISDDLLALADEVTGGDMSFEELGKYLKNQFFDILIQLAMGIDVVRMALGNLANFAIQAADMLGLFEGNAEEVGDAIAVMIGNLNTNQTQKAIANAKELIKSLDAAGVDVSFTDKLFEDLKKYEQAAGQGGIKGFFQSLFGQSEAQQIIKTITNQIGDLALVARSAVDLGEFGPKKPPLIDLLFDTNPSNAIASFIEYLEALKNLPSIVPEIIKEEEVEEEIKGLFERIGDTLKSLIGDNIIEGLRESLSQAGFGDFEKTLVDGLTRAAMAFEDALTDAFMTGELSLKKFGDLLRETLVRAFIQKTITNPIGALMGLAEGGPARANTPYIVGEKGPELFIPNHSGTVVPNDETMNAMAGGGTTQVTYNINAIDSQSLNQALSRDPEFIYNLTRVGARRTPG